jgi:hypothetical protein
VKNFFSFLGLCLLLVIGWLSIDQYILSPKYSFAEPTPFSGDIVINPYERKNLSIPDVANFHAHIRAWAGITNGKGRAEDVYRRYDSLGHDYHAVSQYHHIDTFGSHLQNYVPVYEHGFNVLKTHQLVIGAKNIEWKDYILPQTIHNKQDILYKLSRDAGNVIVINHPANRNGYTTNDLKYLHFYDCIELLNPSVQSIGHWDTLLSSGKKIFAIGNDDIHNVFQDDALGRFGTFIFEDSIAKNNIYNSLRSGASAAVWLPHTNESLQSKRIRIEKVKKVIKNISFRDSLFSIRLNQKVKEIALVTDHGRIKKTEVNAAQLLEKIFPSETYWRFELLFEDGTKIFLNPLYRQREYRSLARNSIASQNVGKKRNESRLAIFLGFITLFIGTSKSLLKKKKRRINRIHSLG